MTGNAGNAVNAPFQLAAAIQSRRAMNDALNISESQQRAYQAAALANQGAQVIATGPESFNRTLQSGAADRMAGYNQLYNTQMGFPQSNRNVASSARDASMNSQLGQNRANLGAYGDAAMQQWLANQEAARRLEKLVSFAGGQASVLPYQMYEAQHKGDDIAALGQLLSSSITGAAITANEFGAFSPPSGTPSANQSSAFNAGYGPVSLGYANQIANTTPAQANTQLYSNQYGMPYFSLY
jgi:hypothetical protein